MTAIAIVNFEVTAEEITDKEMGLWKLLTVLLPKTDNPLGRSVMSRVPFLVILLPDVEKRLWRG